MIPTKKGLGVEVWGTIDDLIFLYNTISNFWNIDGFTERSDFEGRDNIISGFVHELRKASEGKRMKRTHSHISYEQLEYHGFKISWVHILFFIGCLRYNMKYFYFSKLDLAKILQIEFWVDKCIADYDYQSYEQLKYFMEGGIYSGNESIYLVMRSVNMDFFKLKGGKIAFRKLPKLLKRAQLGTDEFNSFNDFLIQEAKSQNCKINDLDFSDDHINYEIIW